jgi:hypothetical protein
MRIGQVPLLLAYMENGQAPTSTGLTRFYGKTGSAADVPIPMRKMNEKN